MSEGVSIMTYALIYLEGYPTTSILHLVTEKCVPSRESNPEPFNQEPLQLPLDQNRNPVSLSSKEN